MRPHGTFSRYTNNGCRCDDCRRANTAHAAAVRTGPPQQQPRPIVRALPWLADAACKRRPDLPWVADRPPLPQVLEMLAICDACPVLHQCAVDMGDDKVGIRAGRRWVSDVEPSKAREAKRIEPRPCRWCGTPFLVNAMGPRAVYCSDACRIPAEREVKRLQAQRRASA